MSCVEIHGPTTTRPSGQVDAAARICATVREIRAALGLACLDGDDGRGWAVTQGTLCDGLDSLEVGQRVQLLIATFGPSDVVREQGRRC